MPPRYLVLVSLLLGTGESGPTPRTRRMRNLSGLSERPLLLFHQLFCKTLQLYVYYGEDPGKKRRYTRFTSTQYVSTGTYHEKFSRERYNEMFRLADARFAPVRRPAVARAARVRLLQWGAVALRPDVAVVRVRRELNGRAAAERGIEHAGQQSVQGRGADNVVGSCSSQERRLHVARRRLHGC